MSTWYVHIKLTIFGHLWQGFHFQYFSSVPVLNYLQTFLFIKIWTFSWISYITPFKIRKHQLPFQVSKSTWYHPYWMACFRCFVWKKVGLESLFKHKSFILCLKHPCAILFQKNRSNRAQVKYIVSTERKQQMWWHLHTIIQ
jgi:hypothetical protein